MKTNTESFSFCEVPSVVQSVETESGLVVSRARWRGGMGQRDFLYLYRGCKVSDLQGEKVLELWFTAVELLNTTEPYA